MKNLLTLFGILLFCFLTAACSTPATPTLPPATPSPTASPTPALHLPAGHLPDRPGGDAVPGAHHAIRPATPAHR